MAKYCVNIDKKTKTRCKAWALKGQDYCWFHHPDLAEQRAEQRRKGGQRKRISFIEFPPTKLESIEDIKKESQDLVNLVRAGKIDLKRANILKSLYETSLRAIELGELERRVEALEESPNNLSLPPE